MSHPKYTTQQARVLTKLVGLLGDDQTVEQMRVGTAVEHEHADVTGGDALMEARIAAVHVREDPLYYVWLMAAEAFREGKPAPVRVTVDAVPVAEGSCVVLHVEGHDEPLWGYVVAPQEAKAVAEFLRSRPTLAVMYAWMLLTKDEA